MILELKFYFRFFTLSPFFNLFKIFPSLLNFPKQKIFISCEIDQDSHKKFNFFALFTTANIHYHKSKFQAN